MPDYNSEAGLLNHLKTQKQSINQFKAEAGADDAEILELTNDCDNLEFMIDLSPLAEEFKTTVFGVKRELIAGEEGTTIGTIMTAPATTPPHTLIAGVRKRSRERDGRWKRAKTMTEAARLALDLVDTPDSIAPEDAKPTIQVFAAQTGYTFSVVVANRGASDMWDVLVLRKGAANWETVKTAVGKSVDVTVQPTTPGNAEQMQVRVQLKKNNANYGQPSDIVYVTVNP